MKKLMNVILAFALSAPLCHAMEVGSMPELQQFFLNEGDMNLWLIPSMCNDNVTFTIFNKSPENRESLKANVLEVFKKLLAQGRSDREIQFSFREFPNNDKAFFTISWHPTQKGMGAAVQWTNKDEVKTAINATFRFDNQELQIFTAIADDALFFNGHLPQGFQITSMVVPMTDFSESSVTEGK